MGNVLAPEAYDHIFCSNMMFLHCNKSLRWQTEVVEDVDTELGGPNKRLLHVFDVYDHAPVFSKRPGVYNRDPGRRDLIHTSLWKPAIHFWRNV